MSGPAGSPARPVVVSQRIDYVRLGSPALSLPPVSGCMTYGSQKWRDWVLEGRRAGPVPPALEAGITFFRYRGYVLDGVSRRNYGAPEGLRRRDESSSPPVFNPMGDDPYHEGSAQTNPPPIATPAAAGHGLLDLSRFTLRLPHP